MKWNCSCNNTLIQIQFAMLIRKRKLLMIFLLIFGAFLLFIIHVITKSGSEVMSSDDIEQKIYKVLKELPARYKNKPVKSDNSSDIFVSNLNVRTSISSIEDLWRRANSWVSKSQMYDLNNKNLGTVLNALKSTKIIKADLDKRGTQLKFLLTLEAGQQVVYKPQWYEINTVIEGPVYAGKDRFGAEILAFYLSGLLNKPLVPISAVRTVSLKKDLLPVATDNFLETVFERNNSTCVFGTCYYCTKADPVCDNSKSILSGAAIFNIKNKLKSHRSPWQRTYKKGKQALWQTSDDYCRTVINKLPRNRIFDLVDVAVFDFLIQNGDRHHYEVLDNNIIWIDNGKALGNPYIQHIDILAPLYQCCLIRKSTWERLQQLSGGLLKDKLLLMPDIENIVTESHLNAMEERLLIVYATVEYCKTRSKIDNGGL